MREARSKPSRKRAAPLTLGHYAMLAEIYGRGADAPPAETPEYRAFSRAAAVALQLVAELPEERRRHWLDQGRALAEAAEKRPDLAPAIDEAARLRLIARPQ